MDSYSFFYIYDSPVPYKDLLIYPATMRDYIQLHFYADCLLLDKNSYPDVNIISMTYLGFLYYISTQHGNEELTKLNGLFHLCFKVPMDDENGGIKYYTRGGNPYFLVNGIEYDSDDFENIRKIICDQNCIEMLDENIQKEVRDEMDKAKEQRRKQNQNKICSLEDQMICALISTNLKMEDIYDLTVRKFSKILQRVDHKLHYQIYKTASMSGFVEFKDKSMLKGWMSDLEENDKYSDVKVDRDEFEQKISNSPV